MSSLNQIVPFPLVFWRGPCPSWQSTFRQQLARMVTTGTDVTREKPSCTSVPPGLRRRSDIWTIPCVLSSLYSQPLILMFFTVLEVPCSPFTNHMAVLQPLPQPCIQEFLAQPTFPCLNNTSSNPPPSQQCFPLLTRLELRHIQVWWGPFLFFRYLTTEENPEGRCGAEVR